MLYSLLVLLITVSTAFTATTTWDCGHDDKSIKINRAGVLPDPIPYPGNLTIDTELEVVRDIPSTGLAARLTLIKLEPERMLVDCINGIGSCVYDVCNELLPNNQVTFCQLGICQCPFTMKKYASTSLPYQIQDLGGPVFGAIMQGNFEGNITFFNKLDNKIYGCLGMKFKIQNTLSLA
ncbi:uncharacterized protein LOC141853688 [Brevipalpus obovatus]|uniref:uncharacterized protein LOC141853688 n=1 Tax=Brevipalpus obovatus TaxID=246614 RepID=UPI003D9E79B8